MQAEGREFDSLRPHHFLEGAQMKRRKPTSKWRKKSEIYKMFIPDNLECTLSEQDEIDMFMFETHNEGDLEKSLFLDPPFNGYVVGKKFMTVIIEMWKEDISLGRLYKFELEQDYPKWWLDQVLRKVKQGAHNASLER